MAKKRKIMKVDAPVFYDPKTNSLKVLHGNVWVTYASPRAYRALWLARLGVKLGILGIILGILAIILQLVMG